MSISLLGNIIMLQVVMPARGRTLGQSFENVEEEKQMHESIIERYVLSDEVGMLCVIYAMFGDQATFK